MCYGSNVAEILAIQIRFYILCSETFETKLHMSNILSPISKNSRKVHPLIITMSLTEKRDFCKQFF